LAEAEHREVIVHLVDAHLVGQRVIEDIARFDDGAFHVYLAMTPFLPVAVTTFAAGQTKPAGAEDLVLRGEVLELETGESDEGLDGRAWRILAIERAVEKRPLGRRQQALVGVAGDTVDKKVGVINRGAHKGEQGAAGRIHGNHRSVLVTQSPLGHPLQRSVDGEMNVRARSGIDSLENTQNSALGVGLDVLKARLTVQQRLVSLLDAGLSDMRRAAILRGIHAAELLLAHAPDVAEQMHR